MEQGWAKQIEVAEAFGGVPGVNYISPSGVHVLSLLPDRIAAAHPELLVRTALAPELMGAADPPRLPPAKSRA